MISEKHASDCGLGTSRKGFAGVETVGFFTSVDVDCRKLKPGTGVQRARGFVLKIKSRSRNRLSDDPLMASSG
jgi:hypothetical protein